MKKPTKRAQGEKVKKMTIEDLALMVAKGFEGVATKFEGVATKDDIGAVIVRLDRIEHLLIRALDNRTTKLEDDMRVLKTTVERLLKKV